MSRKIIRLPAIKEITGLSRSSIYLRMRKREFPQSFSLGGRAVGWLESDVHLWVEQCIEASQK